jgi:hypothetical protein
LFEQFQIDGIYLLQRRREFRLSFMHGSNFIAILALFPINPFMWREINSANLSFYRVVQQFVASPLSQRILDTSQNKS